MTQPQHGEGSILALRSATLTRLGDQPEPPLDLVLLPGELALIAADRARAARIADLATGIEPPATGEARFLGRDWATQPPDHAAGLRGRIGRVFGSGGWLPWHSLADNVILPALHHTNLRRRLLRDEAAALARGFGLPGLPTALPDQLPAETLARGALIRALLGRPSLILLESPRQGRFLDLTTPLLRALTAAMDRGAAIVWFATDLDTCRDRSLPAAHRLRLADRGLVTVRAAR